jgi:hypothetical protein
MGQGLRKFKRQMARGKWQMENHLKFDICRLPFDLLVLEAGSPSNARRMDNPELAIPSP